MQNTQETTFILFRHGETNANKSRIMQGNTNSGVYLTEKGQQQATELGEKLSHRFDNIDFMLSSGMDRVNSTLQIVGDPFNIPEKNFCTIPTLRGVNKGNLTGAGYEEFVTFLQAHNSDVVKAEQIATREALQRYMQLTFPEGESRGGCGLRAINSLISFYETKQNTLQQSNVAVCMHSSTMSIMKAIRGLSPIVANTEVIELKISELFEIRSEIEILISNN